MGNAGVQRNHDWHFYVSACSVITVSVQAMSGVVRYEREKMYLCGRSALSRVVSSVCFVRGIPMKHQAGC